MNLHLKQLIAGKNHSQFTLTLQLVLTPERIFSKLGILGSDADISPLEVHDMQNEPKGQFGDANRQGDTPTSKRVDRHLFLKEVAGGLAVSLLCGGVAAAQGNSPTQLRRFIDEQVGGSQKMLVPAHDTERPHPRTA